MTWPPTAGIMHITWPLLGRADVYLMSRRFFPGFSSGQNERYVGLLSAFGSVSKDSLLYAEIFLFSSHCLKLLVTRKKAF